MAKTSAARDYMIPLLLSALIGAIAGGVSGGITSRIITPSAPATETPGSATSTPAEPTVIRVEPEGPRRVPPGDLVRRQSPVATIYRRIRAESPEARTLNDGRMLGQAVSLTTDGWFVTVGDVVDGFRPSELTLWHDGVSYHVDHIVTDAVNGTAYLNVEARDLPSLTFSAVDQLLLGSEAWLESRPRGFEATLVHALRLGSDDAAPVSSEVATRRIAVSAAASDEDRGAPLWDSRGALLGLVESGEGRARVIPSNSIASSFASLLAKNEIQHAALGVTTRDLAAWRVDGDRGTYPSAGALVTAVKRGSPAENAGIRAGDVILQVERDILDGDADLGETLAEFQAGTDVSIRFLRDGAEQTVTVVLGTHVSSEEIL